LKIWIQKLELGRLQQHAVMLDSVAAVQFLADLSHCALQALQDIPLGVIQEVGQGHRL